MFNELEQYIGRPEAGLPEEIFEFVSAITPMVNVDLLIYDKDNQILLSWRDDEDCEKGWHIPGGIVRFKECRLYRIQEVARKEIGIEVCFDLIPLDIKEIIMPQKIRGHVISLFYIAVIYQKAINYSIKH